MGDTCLIEDIQVPRTHQIRLGLRQIRIKFPSGSLKDENGGSIAAPPSPTAWGNRYNLLQSVYSEPHSKRWGLGEVQLCSYTDKGLSGKFCTDPLDTIIWESLGPAIFFY